MVMEQGRSRHLGYDTTPQKGSAPSQAINRRLRRLKDSRYRPLSRASPMHDFKNRNAESVFSPSGRALGALKKGKWQEQIPEPER